MYIFASYLFSLKLFICYLYIYMYVFASYLFICYLFLLCRNFKHKLGTLPKPKAKINHSTGGNVGILSKIVLNLELCQSVQKCT